MVSPPSTKRKRARRSGGASTSPTFTATGLPPQRTARKIAVEAPRQSSGRSGGTRRRARGAGGRPCRGHGSMGFHEDRADRASQERQDVALQPADRRDGGHLVL